MVQNITDAIVVFTFLIGAGFGGAYGAKAIFEKVQKEALSKKLSPTEPFAQKLTGEKLPF